MKPWDWPDCPHCEHNIYVNRPKGNMKAFNYLCHKCGRHFNE